MSVVESILSFGRTRCDAPALVEGMRTMTYGELADATRRVASHLGALGMRRGQRIGLLLKDTIEHLVVLLGVAHGGGVAVPLDWRARPAENARFIDGLALDCVLAEADARPAGTGRRVLLDAGWHEAVARAGADTGPVARWTDPFVISASSGSTGAPKFTQMTHLQFHFAISGMLELMDLAGRHRFLCTMPLYYSGGRNSCLAHLLRGDCAVLHSSLFSAAEYVDLVERYAITVAGLVPSDVRQLLAVAGTTALLPRLTKLFSTGAPLSAEEKCAAVRGLTPNFHERYGTAETMVISLLKPADFATYAASVGQPHSLATVEVVDECDRPMPCGSVGRLRFRGPGMASPVAGANASNFRDGWYYPGEIARLDEAGYLFLEGRSAEVIMRGGAKIHPAEVEGALRECAGVLDAAVLGHRFDGAEDPESVVAFVVGESSLTVGRLLLHCRVRLTSHKVPRNIYIVTSLPYNTAGKVDKIALGRLLGACRT